MTVLNLKDGVTVSEVAQEIDLPRTTTYRILETLCQAGYAYRSESDEKYRLTIMVRGLSDGFDDEAWITQTAKPFIYELCRDIVWPVSIATLSGTSMLVRETTDHQSPLAVERYGPGYRVPMLASASGLAYLAFCENTQRDALLDMLARSKNTVDHPARNRTQVQKLLMETRERGFSIHTRPRRVSHLTTFSVPVISDGRLMAALTVRFSSTALTQTAAIERFVPRMRRAADQIGGEFARQRAEYENAQPGTK